MAWTACSCPTGSRGSLLARKKLAEHRPDVAAGAHLAPRECRAADRLVALPKIGWPDEPPGYARDVDVREVAHDRHQHVVGVGGTLPSIVESAVAVGRLRDVHVPLLAGVALFNDLVRELQRGQHERAARLRIVEERLLVDFFGF